MNTQVPLLGSEGRTDSPVIITATEADYTPVPVAVQALLVLQQTAGRLPPAPRILCPAAGSGCYARAARAVFGPRTHITAVEPRASEREGLLAAADEVHIATFEEFCAGLEPDHALAFDIICDNIPFSRFLTWPGLIRRTQLLAPAGMVMFYGLTQFGQADNAAPAMKEWSPTYQWRVGGRVSHRGHGTWSWRPISKDEQVLGGPTEKLVRNGTDARETCHWAWTNRLPVNMTRPRWTTEQLPELPTAYRRWEPSAVPGTYPIEPALVAEIRRRYL